MLQWANDKTYIKAIIKAGHFKKTDNVLEVGAGSGIMSEAIAPLVKSVLAMDILHQNKPKGNNISFFLGDIRNPALYSKSFDKIIARHSFHHILEKTQEAMNQCHRLLKEEGLMVLSEGVPPCPEVLCDYIDIFRLKEERITFTESGLVLLMKTAGFKNIKSNTLILKQMSVKNWLESANVSQEVKKQIYEKHLHGSPTFRSSYNMVVLDNDCLIDMKMVIVTGGK